MFFNKYRFKSRLDTNLAQLGSILAPKGCEMRGQKGPKRHQKRDQNDIKMLIDFGIDFGPIWEAQGGLSQPPCGMRGPWLDSFELKEFEYVLKTVQTRSDPSGGGGFNRFAQSAGPGCKVLTSHGLKG